MPFCGALVSQPGVVAFATADGVTGALQRRYGAETALGTWKHMLKGKSIEIGEERDEVVAPWLSPLNSADTSSSARARGRLFTSRCSCYRGSLLSPLVRTMNVSG